MDIPIPLNEMTTIDKLRVIEDIWENLLLESEKIPSPAWHADVLSAREKRMQNGESQFSDWDDAKARIRNNM